MRWARHWGRSSHADGWGLIVASLFFGGVHAGGSLTFVLLATLAGFAYGLVYYVKQDASIMPFSSTSPSIPFIS